MSSLCYSNFEVRTRRKCNIATAADSDENFIKDSIVQCEDFATNGGTNRHAHNSLSYSNDSVFYYCNNSDNNAEFYFTLDNK